MGFEHSKLGGHRSELLRYVGRRVDNVALREDIVQEAFLRLLTYEAKPDNTISNVAGLLRRISLNLIRDHFRRAGRHTFVELSEDVPCLRPSVQQQLEQRQLVELVSEVLKAMPRLRRNVFFRRRVEGQSSREVASALGLTPGAVDAHVARAVLDLHRAMEKIEAHEKRGWAGRG